ncbi:MAG: MFS transporter [Pseudomonadota bacterium]|mgnify:CR=1 FL=1|uniref:AmpG family muropeptide MFS transporter n=1 Tax=unclassified Phenylobacterium TaxID=2640670 RepID=UPI0006F90BD2|nr:MULTISPECIES: MFS transporter [unclassified Phenylobacterium]KRB48648.1 permease [Phenylobacterium sp. Root700]MBT9473551.1 MFS transporter [Phenylobacterium sp.]
MTTESQAAAQDGKKPGTLQALAVYLERRSLVMLSLGFASGLPNLLIFDTLSAWLRDAGLSLEVIAFFGLATLAYSLKFLWAPLVDRATVPLVTKWLGHRRSWMLVCQVLIVLGLWLIAGTNPAVSLGLMALFAVMVGFVSATQDIVIDAWRIEAAVTEKQGAMAAAYQWGYRIAMIVAGVVPLALSEFVGWNTSYAIMALLMLVGVLGVLGAPREAQHEIRRIDAHDIPAAPARDGVEWAIRLGLFVLGALVLGSGLAGNAAILSGGLTKLGLPGAAAGVEAMWSAKPWGVFAQVSGVVIGAVVIFLAARPAPGLKTRPGRYLGVALGAPLADFFRRYGQAAGLILALICVYRLSDFVLNIMNPFYLDMGFSKLEIAEVRKVLGAVMSVLGVGLGGFAIARFGLIRALVVGAFAGPISNLVFAWLATQGPQLWALSVAIGVDNVASGFSGTCLIAYMSSLTGQGFTATQYALFSSLYALLGKLVASQSGRIVEGAAAAADSGGLFASLKSLFAALPPETFASAMEKSGVSAAALGSGYMVFFCYSALLGVIGIVLAFMVARLPPIHEETPAAP